MRALSRGRLLLLLAMHVVPLLNFGVPTWLAILPLGGTLILATIAIISDNRRMFRFSVAPLIRWMT
ncbi:hypothetical protein [Plantibacter sp. RU18]|uniref:hypothetical protein n=1 Tax=Plantibacter sp. RU18 TaxID=3158143 RepID=UPI003D3630A8